MCNHGYYINYNLADVICRQMNFTQASRWTTKESYDIQSNYDTYVLVHDYVECISGEWENCTYSQYTYNCDHSQDVFLSCTGNIYITPIRLFQSVNLYSVFSPDAKCFLMKK